MNLPKLRRLVLIVPALLPLFLWVFLSHSSLPLLPDRAPASWIIYPTPAEGAGSWASELSTEFRHSFWLETNQLGSAVISLCSLKHSVLSINGKAIELPIRDLKKWKEPIQCDVAAFLKAGTNEVSVTVVNDEGLPALWLALRVGKKHLESDSTWTASLAGGTWLPARLASEPLLVRPGNPLYARENPLTSFWKHLPIYLCLAVAFGLVAVLLSRCRPDLLSRMPASRWLWFGFVAFAAAWIVLWLNNLRSLPAIEGFDVEEHLKYIDYILQRHSLPLANEGFEMYQPPLYYLISAALLAPFHLAATDPHAIYLLRLFGMVCGITTFLLVFLSIRRLFPNDSRKQWFGLCLAAAMPANIYLCHFVTNEILSTMLGAAAMLACFRIWTNPRVSLDEHGILGAVLGAALLAKSSALPLLPVIFGVVVWNLWLKGVRRPTLFAACLSTLVLACLLVCGWHYGRVAAHFGNPLVGNWESKTGFHWWQQKGFRTEADYLRFGEALKSPSYSAISSFPDGIYSTMWGDAMWGGRTDVQTRPPWNYDWMAAGYLVALVPTAAILIGLVWSVVRLAQKPEAGNAAILAIACLFGLLLVYYSIKVPSYATAKAFYGFGALVPICAFGAAGLDALSRSRVARGICSLLLIIWVVNVFASFWINHNGRQAQFLIAQDQSKRGHHDLAISTLTRILDRSPHDGQVASWLAFELIETGNLAQARKVAENSLTWAENDADCHLVMGAVLVLEGKLEQATCEAGRAAVLAPDHPLAAGALADWLNRSGQKQAAVVACRDAIRIRPAQKKPHLIMASAEADLGNIAEAEFHRRLAECLKDE